jgi:predicted NBD/HSP70 family sugar kinase
MLKGHDAILAVDIGGTNIRCGIVKTRHRKARDFSLAKVVRRDEVAPCRRRPNRGSIVEHIAEMLEDMVLYSERKKIRLAPFIGIGCPGSSARMARSRAARRTCRATGKATPSICRAQCGAACR